MLCQNGLGDNAFVLEYFSCLTLGQPCPSMILPKPRISIGCALLHVLLVRYPKQIAKPVVISNCILMPDYPSFRPNAVMGLEDKLGYRNALSLSEPVK